MSGRDRGGMGKSELGPRERVRQGIVHTGTHTGSLGLMSDGQWVHSVSIMQEQRLSIHRGKAEGHLRGTVKGTWAFQGRGHDFLLMCFPTSWSRLDVAGTPRLPMSAVRDTSQGCGEEPQHWLGKAKE